MVVNAAPNRSICQRCCRLCCSRCCLFLPLLFLLLFQWMDLLFVSPVDEIVVVSVDNFVVFLFQKIKFKKFYSKSIEVKTSKLRSHQLFQAIRKRLAPRTLAFKDTLLQDARGRLLFACWSLPLKSPPVGRLYREASRNTQCCSMLC